MALPHGGPKGGAVIGGRDGGLRPQDPSNSVYQKALEMTQKAPELHAELQRQLAAQGEV